MVIPFVVLELGIEALIEIWENWQKVNIFHFQLPQVAPSIQEFDIIGDCRSFSREEMLRIFEMAFQSVMDAEGEHFVDYELLFGSSKCTTMQS